MAGRRRERQRFAAGPPALGGEPASAPRRRAAAPRLAQILRDGECRDPALREASITVTEARVSPDLRNATVYVMPLGGANAAAILAGLERSAPFLRRLVARELALRHVPNLVFALDDTFDQAEPDLALAGAARGRARSAGATPAEGENDDDAG